MPVASQGHASVPANWRDLVKHDQPSRRPELCGSRSRPPAQPTFRAPARRFPYPIYAKWADAYKKETNIGLNYQSIGSGGGIKQIKAKTVVFGATDAPLTRQGPRGERPHAVPCCHGRHRAGGEP